MDLRTLGTTGLHVAPIGFGAFKIGRNEKIKYAEGYELPSDDEVDALLARLLDAGINLIDTAPAYGTSEEQIGRFLKASGRRDDIVLATKVGEQFHNGVSHYAFDRQSIEDSLDASLRRLQTDHLDLVCVHSDGRDEAILQESDVLEVLTERQARGDVAHIGFSGKTLAGHRLCLNSHPTVAVLMIELSPLEHEQRPLLREAGERGVGILVKKGLAAGRAPAEEAIPWILDHPEVASLLIGSLSAEHMTHNLRLASRG